MGKKKSSPQSSGPPIPKGEGALTPKQQQAKNKQQAAQLAAYESKRIELLQQQSKMQSDAFKQMTDLLKADLNRANTQRDNSNQQYRGILNQQTAAQQAFARQQQRYYGQSEANQAKYQQNYLNQFNTFRTGLLSSQQAFQSNYAKQQQEYQANALRQQQQYQTTTTAANQAFYRDFLDRQAAAQAETQALEQSKSNYELAGRTRDQLQFQDQQLGVFNTMARRVEDNQQRQQSRRSTGNRYQGRENLMNILG